MGVFYPFARDHNEINWRDQEPFRFKPYVTDSARISMYLRYSLMKFYYT